MSETKALEVVTVRDGVRLVDARRLTFFVGASDFGLRMLHLLIWIVEKICLYDICHDFELLE